MRRNYEILEETTKYHSILEKTVRQITYYYPIVDGILQDVTRLWEQRESTLNEEEGRIFCFKETLFYF